MEYKKIILALLLAMTLGSTNLMYANETRAEPSQSQVETESLAQLYHKAGLDSPEVIVNTLVDLGISKEELQEAVEEGKKIYDLLQEKSITMERFKKALTKEYRSKINQAKKEKIITKKEAKILSELLKERMNQWEI